MSKRHARKAKVTKVKRRSPPGSMPGLIVVDPAAPRPVISVIDYDTNECREHRRIGIDELAELLARRSHARKHDEHRTPARSAATEADHGEDRAAGSPAVSHGVMWIDVVGLGDAAVIQRIGELFGLHRLELEDIVSTHQRAKVEDYGDHSYLVLRECLCKETLDLDQVSICLGRGWMISFQGKPGDCYEPIRQRIRQSKGKIRALGADHLAYALIDAIIDSYFPALEHLGETLESLEDEATGQPSPHLAHGIHDIKRELLAVRRAVWPAREAVSALLRDDCPLITHETRIYLRDCYDHVIQLIDIIETYREVGSGLMDIHLASMSNRMNEVMKMLTVIATIFMPLSFIAGVYGMNFNTQASSVNMPELNWVLGYPFALAIMFATAFGMLTYFKRKGWIFTSPRKPRRGPYARSLQPLLNQPETPQTPTASLPPGPISASAGAKPPRSP